MQDQAFGWGRMSQPKYAGMAASAGLQGDMAGRGLGMMLGGQDPLMQKQDLIDEIMRKHPDPRTPEELEAVANDLQAAGLSDLAMQVRGVANETRTAFSKTAKAAKPSKDLYDQINFGLTSSVLGDKFLDSYLAYSQPDYMTKYNGLSNDQKKGEFTTTQYNNKRAAAKKELENQFKSFRNWISRQPNMGINEINSLLSNENMLNQAFKEWADDHTSNEFAEFLNNNMFNAPDKPTDTPINSDGSDVQQETPSGAVDYTNDFTEPESLEQFDIDATKMLEHKSVDEKRTIFDTLLQKSIGANGIPSPSNLNNADKILFQKLMDELGLDSMGNPSTVAFNSQTQQWFEQNFELA
jgi:hypothetical protein